MLSRVRQCSLRTSQAFQHLSSKGVPNHIKLFPSFQPQTNNLFYNSRFYFADTLKETKQDVPPVNTQETKQEQQETEKVEEIRESFVEYMKREIKPEEMIYEYSNPTFYQILDNLSMTPGTRKTFTGHFVVFGGITVYVAMNFSLWMAIFPGLFTVFIFFARAQLAHFTQKFVQKMELVDPYHIKIYPVDKEGKYVLCDIKDTRVVALEILEDQQGKPMQSYIVHANFVESVTKKRYRDMHLPVDAKRTSIENVDLFKCIVNGKADEISKFKLVQDKEGFSDLFESSEVKVNEEKNKEEKEADISERTGKVANN